MRGDNWNNFSTPRTRRQIQSNGAHESDRLLHCLKFCEHIHCLAGAWLVASTDEFVAR